MSSPRDSQSVRVRFAPSPTGLLHLGGARTAMYNYLLARQTGGQFILRLEDTDQKRFDPTAEQDLKDSLRWLGLQWDEGIDVGGPHEPYRQSERKAIYQPFAQQLIDSGHAFYCFCTREELDTSRQEQKARGVQARYAGPCRELPAETAHARVAVGEDHVIRFKMPKDGSITIVDRLRGDITFENRNLDDYVIVKSDGLPVYHLAAMVDDHLMGITHVFRGEEWIPTFPLHAHIYRAFGWQEPEWVHLSLFLKPSGKGKMSKRETEAMRLTGQTIFIKEMQGLGYLPEAVLNWIALMGWSYDDSTEFFTLDDLIQKFSIDKLNPSNAAIDFRKFDHFNGLHIRALAPEDVARRCMPFLEQASIPADMDTLLRIIPLIRERMVTLDEAPEWTAFFFKDSVDPAPESLIAKDLTAAQSHAALQRATAELEALPEWTHTAMETRLRALVEELGLKAGQLFGLLRNATAAQPVSPPLFESMEILGRDVSLGRLRHALTLLESQLQ
ncbi:MAG: glutamate--tRNA ligase [Anaerolineae bacterium]|nr:MAG: glutamate--tRNA ligase [Anaerolineae bacterium]